MAGEGVMTKREDNERKKKIAGLAKEIGKI